MPRFSAEVSSRLPSLQSLRTWAAPDVRDPSREIAPHADVYRVDGRTRRAIRQGRYVDLPLARLDPDERGLSSQCGVGLFEEHLTHRQPAYRAGLILGHELEPLIRIDDVGRFLERTARLLPRPLPTRLAQRDVATIAPEPPHGTRQIDFSINVHGGSGVERMPELLKYVAPPYLLAWPVLRETGRLKAGGPNGKWLAPRLEELGWKNQRGVCEAHVEGDCFLQWRRAPSRDFDPGHSARLSSFCGAPFVRIGTDSFSVNTSPHWIHSPGYFEGFVASRGTFVQGWVGLLPSASHDRENTFLRLFTATEAAQMSTRVLVGYGESRLPYGPFWPERRFPSATLQLDLGGGPWKWLRERDKIWKLDELMGDFKV